MGMILRYLCSHLLMTVNQRYIRGSGLAYGAYVGIDLEAGFVSFTLYRVSKDDLQRTRY